MNSIKQNENENGKLKKVFIKRQIILCLKERFINVNINPAFSLFFASRKNPCQCQANYDLSTFTVLLPFPYDHACCAVLEQKVISLVHE